MTWVNVRDFILGSIIFGIWAGLSLVSFIVIAFVLRMLGLY